MITLIPSSQVKQALSHLIQLATINRMIYDWQKDLQEHSLWPAYFKQDLPLQLFTNLRSTFAVLIDELPHDYLTPSDLRSLLEQHALNTWKIVLRSISREDTLLANTLGLCLYMREVVLAELSRHKQLDSSQMHFITLLFDWIIEKTATVWEEQHRSTDKILTIASMEIDHLRKIAESVHSPVDLHPVFQTIVDRVRNSGLWPMCAIGITDVEGKEIVVPAQAGFAEGYPLDLKFPAIGSATLETIRRMQPIAISDVASDIEFPVLQEAARAGGYRSILLVPLSVEDVRAVVTFGSPEPHEYSQEEISLANAIAQQVMISIENANQYGREKHRVMELESLNQLIAEQNQRLQRITDTHTALTKLVLNDAGMDAIMRAVRKLLGNPVTIENERFELLSFSEDWDYFDQHRRASIQAGGTPPDAFNHPELKGILNGLRKNRRALLIPSHPSLGIEKRRILAPIIAGWDILGYVWVMESMRPFIDQDLIIAEQSALVLALEMVKQRAAIETEMRLKADFFEDLLFKDTFKERDLLQKANRLGYDFKQPTLLLLLECTEPSLNNLPTYSREQRNRQIFITIQNTINRFTSENIVALHSDQVLAITPLLRVNSDPHSVAADLAENIRQDLKRVDPELRVLAGVGGVCQNISEIRRLYRQARRTVNAARNLGNLDKTFSLDDLGIYGVLYRDGDKGELLAFVESSLKPLIEYDQQNGTELLKTLETYLAHQGKRAESARELYIHVNTLRQRLDRIEDVLGVEIDNSQVRFNLQVAIKIFQTIANSGGDRDGAAPLI